MARTWRRHRAFYSRRKRGLTSWTSRRPCAGDAMPAEELCVRHSVWCLLRGSAGVEGGHRRGLRGRILGDPLELQRVAPLICNGDDGVGVVLWDVNDLVTRHNIRFITLLKGAPPPVAEAAAGQAPEPSRPPNDRDGDFSLAPPTLPCPAVIGEPTWPLANYAAAQPAQPNLTHATASIYSRGNLAISPLHCPSQPPQHSQPSHQSSTSGSLSTFRQGIVAAWGALDWDHGPGLRTLGGQLGLGAWPDAVSVA